MVDIAQTGRYTSYLLGICLDIALKCCILNTEWKESLERRRSLEHAEPIPVLSDAPFTPNSGAKLKFPSKDRNMGLTKYQRFRKIEEKLKKNVRISGQVVDLVETDRKRFEKIVCNQLPLPFGHYYEFLFSCILYTILGDQFQKAALREDISEHFDAIICGHKCDFTMDLSREGKKVRTGIKLIRFPHKSYHKGRKVKKEIVDIVINTLLQHIPEAKILEQKTQHLRDRIARYAY